MDSKKMFQILVSATAIIFIGMSVGMGQTSGKPVSGRGVVPLFYDVGQAGNVTCEQAGDYEMIRSTFDEGDLYAGTTGAVTWSTVDNQFLAWDGMHGGLAIILKGEGGVNVYKYDESFTYDSALASPPNLAGIAADLKKITFCWNPVPENNFGSNN